MSLSKINSNEHTASVPLPRGAACRGCRRRKQKCDGELPICQQCASGNRHHECQWDPVPISKAERLEARVRELEEVVDLKWRGKSGLPNSRTPTENVDDADIPPANEVFEHLIDTFLAHSYQIDFPYPVERFRQSLSLPSAHPDSPHPALCDAMCLVACRLSNRNLMHLEPYFLQRATSLLEESLSMVDRLLDFIIATTLVSRYCFYVGYDIRGAHMASSAATFAVSCGLQSLPSQLGEDRPSSPGTRLISPPDSVEALNRQIDTWWTVFLLERDACNVMGLSPSIRDENVSTPWPHWFSQFEDASNPTLSNIAVSDVPFVFLFEGGTLAGMVFDCRRALYSNHSQTAEDMLRYVKVKGSVLLNQATVWARDPTQIQFGTFWSRQRALNVKLNAFILRLPPVTSTSLWEEPSRSQPTCPKRDATRYALLHAYSCCFGAKMQLHGVFASEMPNEYVLLVEAAKDMADVLRNFGNLIARTVPFFAAPNWVAARHVLQRETQRLMLAGLDASSTQSDVEILSAALDIHTDMFPGPRTRV